MLPALPASTGLTVPLARPVQPVRTARKARLARLEPMDGTDGTDGAQGPQGVAGAAGAAGTDGTDGAPGAAGAAGAAGTDGTDGAQGPAGSAGADGLGVPSGGATGEVLAKASAADNDTEWVAQTGGAGGLSAVASDSTLRGDGTAADLLGLTDVEVNQLDSIPGLLAETADLSIEVINRTWTDGTDVAAGGFVSHGSGNAITVAEAAALTYFVTRAVTNADGLLNFVVIRVPDTVDLRDVRTRQRIGGGVDLYIDGWHRIGSAGGFTYAYSHNHLYSGYTARFQIAVTLSTTHFRGESIAENVTVDASAFSGNLSATDTDAQTAFATINALTLGSGGGTDDQTAAEVPFDASTLTGTLAALDDASNVAAALTAIDGFTLGGGGVTGTGEQRIESVTFANITNIAATAMTLTLVAATPIAVEFGDGAASMLSGTGGETTFTIAEAGVYLFEFDAVYPADGDRSTPFIEIQDNSDDSVIGRSTNAYIRNTGTLDDSLIITIDGVVSVPTDDLVVKAVLGNAYNQNNLDANGGKLSLVRIGTGLTGPVGPAGATGPAGAGGDDAATWAEAGSTVTIPTAKYGTASIPGTGLENLSVGNGQLSNFIDGTKISTETIGHGRLHSETGGADEDLHAVMVATGLGAVRWDTGRLCPDAATGTAGQVCAVNTGTTAYELVDQTGGGGGTGDITAVTTANNSGLAGGVTIGAADLSLDVANLQAITSVAVDDSIAVQDLTDSSATRRVTLDNVFTTFASTGIGALAGGGHFFDPTEIVGTSVVAANDNLIIEDESNPTNAARTVAVSLFAASLADGTTITASNGVLSSVSGGATITDTAIAEDATTESTTGGASRQAIAEMRDGERHIRYHTTLPEAVDIPAAQHDDLHILLDPDGNAISLYHFSIVEETEEWLLTVGVGLGVRGYAAGISSGYGHISPNGPSVGFTALNRSTNGRFILTYDRATTGLVRADSRTLYIRQRGTDGNWHVVQMDEIATPYEYVSTTNGHNFTFREGTAYNVIVRRAADTNDGGNIAAVLTTERDIAFEDGASLVQLADVQDLLHIGEVVEVVYQQVAGLAAAEVAVDASAFTGNLSTLDINAQAAFATIDALALGGGGDGVSLSDDDPVSVNIALNDPGTATDASRRDHRHRVDQSNTGTLGVSRYATNAEALLGTSASRTINPASLAHVLASSPSTGDITGVTTSGNSGLSGGVATGTATLILDIHNLSPITGAIADDDRFALSNVSAGADATQWVAADTVRTYMQIGGGGGVALSDAAPASVSIAGASPGTAADASRGDHHHQASPAGETQFGLTRYATDAEALAATSRHPDHQPGQPGPCPGEHPRNHRDGGR